MEEWLWKCLGYLLYSISQPTVLFRTSLQHWYCDGPCTVAVALVFSTKVPWANPSTCFHLRRAGEFRSLEMYSGREQQPPVRESQLWPDVVFWSNTQRTDYYFKLTVEKCSRWDMWMKEATERTVGAEAALLV